MTESLDGEDWVLHISVRAPEVISTCLLYFYPGLCFHSFGWSWSPGRVGEGILSLSWPTLISTDF